MFAGCDHCTSFELRRTKAINWNASSRELPRSLLAVPWPSTVLKRPLDTIGLHRSVGGKNIKCYIITINTRIHVPVSPIINLIFTSTRDAGADLLPRKTFSALLLSHFQRVCCVETHYNICSRGGRRMDKGEHVWSTIFWRKEGK
jgi:hypothetical protein